jgi:flavin reductase (DIM6/NTAB) family NADH-FMN oxidoreductase RutF
MIKDSPICMECKVINIVNMPNHDVLFVVPVNTYCNEDILRLGKAFAVCWSVGREYTK